MKKKIGKELAEFTLEEISSVDDIVSSNAYALKSTLSTNREAYQFIDR